jgi:hypothetical protein
MNTAVAGIFTGTITLLIESHNAARPFDRFELFETGRVLTILPPKNHVFTPRLVISNVARGLIRVAQIDERTPIIEAVFFTGNMGGWIPIGLKQEGSDYYRPLARLTYDCNEIDTARMCGVEICSAARYCDARWYYLLSKQGFTKLYHTVIKSAVTTIALPNVEEFMLSR